MKKRLLTLVLLLLTLCLVLASCKKPEDGSAPAEQADHAAEELPADVLLQSQDGSVVVDRALAQTMTWLQLYSSLCQSYSNYSLYQAYKVQFGDDVDLSTLISDQEVAWIESNVASLQNQLGITLFTYADVLRNEELSEEVVKDSTTLFALFMAAGTETYFDSYLGDMLPTIQYCVAGAGAANAAGMTLDEADQQTLNDSLDSYKEILNLLAYEDGFDRFLKDFIGESSGEDCLVKALEISTLAVKYVEQTGIAEDNEQISALLDSVRVNTALLASLGVEIESEEDPAEEEEPEEILAPVADGLYREVAEQTDLVKLHVTYCDKYGTEQVGDIVIELRPDCAPITTENFKKLVSQGYYNGTEFFRIVEGFMIQGGENDAITADYITGEFEANAVDNPLKHVRGTISMARRSSYYDGVPAYDSASSGFFIVHKTSTANSRSLDGQYAAFGSVVFGIENVDYIAGTELVYSQQYSDVVAPKYPAVIQSATFVVPAE